MAAPSSCSSLSTENGAELNPYQLNDRPGPKGAYEARHVNGGLYVRVDMPGVPPDGVKLVKYGEARKVTFTGKAPKYWVSDSSERVYGGYVLLDQDPTKIDVKMTVKNGCFRLFFPGAHGTLHSLPSKKSTQHSEHKHSGANQELGESHHECCHDKLVRFEEPTPGVNKGVLHSRRCPCRPEGADPSVSHTTTRSHINPFLVHGVEGVHETKLVYDEAVARVYWRLDMPGLRDRECSVRIMDNNSLYCGGDGRKEYHLDEGGRSYLSSFEFLCSCCKILAHTHELKHGVSRILIRQINIRGGRCSFACSA